LLQHLRMRADDTSYAALISLNFSSEPGLLFISGWYCNK
jgi:hypothetical protein